jgi:hypothetical protein
LARRAVKKKLAPEREDELISGLGTSRSIPPDRLKTTTLAEVGQFRRKPLLSTFQHLTSSLKTKGLSISISPDFGTVVATVFAERF